MVEAVYSVDGLERAPPTLRLSGAKAQGKAAADRGVASLNVLDLNVGYCPKSGVWGPDAVTPTRLGEERVILRLARIESGRLAPWIPADDRRRAWALSEVSVSAHRFIARRGLPTEIETQAAALDEAWLRNGVPALCAPLVAEGQIWRLTHDTRGKLGAVAAYSTVSGLRW
jgi:CRISPR-associated endonuclease/helicase Cas3